MQLGKRVRLHRLLTRAIPASSKPTLVNPRKNEGAESEVVTAIPSAASLRELTARGNALALRERESQPGFRCSVGLARVWLFGGGRLRRLLACLVVCGTGVMKLCASHEACSMASASCRCHAGVMAARAGRPVSVTLGVVGILGMASVLLLTGWLLMMLANVDKPYPSDPTYAIVGAVLALGFGIVAVLLWRGALSPRAVACWALVIPVVFVAGEAAALELAGWQVPPVWAVVLVVAAWVLAWAVLRRPGAVAWLRRDPPGQLNTPRTDG